MNSSVAKSSPSAAGFFYRRIGGTLFNEWYLRDCSRKITAVLRAKGKVGHEQPAVWVCKKL